MIVGKYGNRGTYTIRPIIGSRGEMFDRALEDLVHYNHDSVRGGRRAGNSHRLECVGCYGRGKWGMRLSEL